MCTSITGRGICEQPTKYVPESKKPFKPDEADGNNHTSSESSRASKSTSGFRKPVKLPDDYNGKTSLRDYLRHFNPCAVVNDWSPEESAVFLSAALRGDAQKILHGMSDNDCRVYNKLVSRLESCFGRETQQELHQARLLNGLKLERGSLRSLAADIRDACSLAYQDLPPQAQERFCIQHFIDAIGDRDDRMRLRREKPRSLDEALLTACKLEAFIVLETSKSKQWNMRSLSTEKENNMAAGAQATQQDLQEKFEELERQREAQFSTLFGQNEKILKDTTDKQDHLSQSSRNQQQSTPGQPYREQAECWYCKEKGHLRRDCSLWKQRQGNERKAPSNDQRSA
ncbi:uncharacterized protein LOC111340535 [Stylophora pistillata]|uniref:uncharacterized protein LOC111340535 n=1 Tax=Stylophora pistillata TaxID=50429 RepID=UPI000C04F53E|nr:uncharacterized protein LOC111340535 [Stylophora pistillata]XP_022803131.1 uncharacterized protein LOC111340535 [Stylophora pistillata]